MPNEENEEEDEEAAVEDLDRGRDVQERRRHRVGHVQRHDASARIAHGVDEQEGRRHRTAIKGALCTEAEICRRGYRGGPAAPRPEP